MDFQPIPVSDLKGVGPKLAQRLQALGISSCTDLAYHLPRRYEDRSIITPIRELQEGVRATIEVEVGAIRARRAARRRGMVIVEAKVHDDSGALKIVWFNQQYVTQVLEAGDTVALTGEIKRNNYGVSMTNPEYAKITPGKESLHTGRVVPVYPLTAGLTQKQLRQFVEQALEQLETLPDPLPDVIKKQWDVPELNEALRLIHFPTAPIDFDRAQRRLYFDQLFITQLYVQEQRALLDDLHADSLPFNEDAVKGFVNSLPFDLTGAQKNAAWAILQDMEKERPMNRLVVGDVGSGKTVVAAMALYSAVMNGTQAALMAPTEILAKQHYATLQAILPSAEESIGLLTASNKLEQGHQPAIIVGTHALIQHTVQFDNLGLVVVDEQHRFGVNQRRTLRERSGNPDTTPHLLSMTATPIPRTLALALYDDLDISVIDELPAGRKAVSTHIVPAKKRADSYTFIREHLDNGEQCFIIYPLVELSDKSDLKAATDEYERLQKEEFANYNVGLLHGRMKAAEKDEIMQRMRDKQIDVLIATSVVEVGVDIPDATIMVIEHAERFGLSQLHQFRGRVGRNDMQSYCLLFTDSKTEKTLERLNAFTSNNDGFALSEIDLEMRGSGELFGTMQSGFSEAAVVAVAQPKLVEITKEAALYTLENNLLEKYLPLKRKLEEFARTIHLE